jgi:hypothetical protein
VTGHDRDCLGLLLFPNIQACRDFCCNLPNDAPVGRVLSDPRLRKRIPSGLVELRRQGTGSSTYAARAPLMSEPAFLRKPRSSITSPLKSGRRRSISEAGVRKCSKKSTCAWGLFWALVLCKKIFSSHKQTLRARMRWPAVPLFLYKSIY